MEATKKQQFVSFFLLTLGIGFIAMPILILLFSSFKESKEIYMFPFHFFPIKWTLANYLDAWNTSLHKYFLNSLYTSIVPTVTNIFFSLLCGYALAKMNFAGRSIFFKFLLIMMIAPIDMLIIPLFQLFKAFGLLNSLEGIILPNIISAFGVFLLRQFIMQIPDELIDAAKIDGCGLAGILKVVVIPNIVSGIAVLGITTFLYNWNLFLWPFIIISSDSYKTLSTGLAGMVISMNNFNPGGLLAGGIIMIIPVFILFAFFQRGITQAYMKAGIK